MKDIEKEKTQSSLPNNLWQLTAAGQFKVQKQKKKKK